MLFDRFRNPAAAPLVGQQIYLRAPGAHDFEPWSALRAASRQHLQPWEPAWLEDSLTREGYRRRLAWFEKLRRQETGAGFFLFALRDNRLLGGITLSNIRRGAAQCGELGYWIGAPHAGRGYMAEALALVQQHAFGPLGLHRLEAATLPENLPSQRLLQKAGFVAEGVARQYLKINGVWRDHRIYARLASD